MPESPKKKKFRARAGGIALEVEHLPTKCKDLSSKSKYYKEKKREFQHLVEKKICDLNLSLLFHFFSDASAQ
jgi:hypothetical protein